MIYKVSGQQITNHIFDLINDTLSSIKSNYRFDYDLFRVSRLDIKIEPAIMPFFYDNLYKGVVWTDSDALSYLSKICTVTKSAQHSHISDDIILRSRIRQFATAFYRELDTMLTLNKFDRDGKIYKDMAVDLGPGGIDFGYIRSRDSKEFLFAVTHAGLYSDMHKINRKNAKYADNVYFLTAQRDPNNRYGLDCVSPDDILKAIL